MDILYAKKNGIENDFMFDNSFRDLVIRLETAYGLIFPP